jgi:hypothetical protein
MQSYGKSTISALRYVPDAFHYVTFSIKIDKKIKPDFFLALFI